MARLATATREELGPEAQAAWDRVVASRGSVRGPFAVLMHVPEIGGRAAEIGDYLRFHGLLPPAELELATLAAGRESACRYEWAAHEPLALQKGTRPEAIEVVRSNGPLDALTPRERIIVEVVRSLFRERGLSTDLFQRAQIELGREHLVELVTLAGYYRLISFALNGFEVDLPPGAAEPKF